MPNHHHILELPPMATITLAARAAATVAVVAIKALAKVVLEVPLQAAAVAVPAVATINSINTTIILINNNITTMPNTAPTATTVFTADPNHPQPRIRPCMMIRMRGV